MTNEERTTDMESPELSAMPGSAELSVETPAPSNESTYVGRDLQALSVLSNYRDWIVHAFRPYLFGETVEIGAGIGTFSRHLLAYVEKLELVEPSSNLVDDLSMEFSGKVNVTIVSSTVESYISAAPNGSRDSAVFVNVLEHIEDDAEVMSGLFRLLRPGGHLLIFVPALSWLFSALDSAVGHCRRYNKNGLTALMKEAGFEVVSVRYFDLLVPVTRALEAVISPPVGKNLVLVARKPDARSEAEKDARL
jgi:SAM-dependent methyltransferase